MICMRTCSTLVCALWLAKNVEHDLSCVNLALTLLGAVCCLNFLAHTMFLMTRAVEPKTHIHWIPVCIGSCGRLQYSSLAKSKSVYR
jgi:hypothetical protein